MSAVADRFTEALEKFREGRYVEASEGFEALWHAAVGVDRDFYQGWVLVSAALFHRDRGNARGAASCLARAEGHWGAVTPQERRAELARVLAAVRRVVDQEWAHPDLGGDPEPGRRGEEGKGGRRGGEEESW